MLYTIIDDLRNWASQYFANLVRLGAKGSERAHDAPLGSS